MVAVVAAVGGILGYLIAPVTTRIDGIQTQINKNEQVDDVSVQDRLSVHTKISAIETKFAEIETQFRNLDERTKRMEETMRRDNDVIQAFDNASRSDREGIHTQIASMETKFVEIETQFRFSKNEADLATATNETGWSDTPRHRLVLKTRSQTHQNRMKKPGRKPAKKPVIKIDIYIEANRDNVNA
jgi:septal ring factor EnvC (AmiA/AmiB activator)